MLTRNLAVVAIAAVVTAAGIPALWSSHEVAHSMRREPGPRRRVNPPRPNVLVFLTDDQRYEGTMSMLPSVKKWFGDEGTEFTDSFVTTPLCCPSRASILTGRYAHNHGVLQNGTDAVKRLKFSKTLPAYLKSAGYRTALFGKYFNKWPKDTAPRFFDRFAISGADYYGARFNVNGRLRTIDRYATDYISDLSNRYVSDAATRKRPWLMYVSPVAVHAPYQAETDYADADIPDRVPDESVDESDRSDKPPWVRGRPLSDPLEVDRKHDGQLRALMSVDDMVDRVMTTLARTGQSDNTLAMFMSDNGFMWGEHGLGQKKYPYIPSIQVPLYVRWPGRVPEGNLDGRLAANVDITPTILDAAGIEPEEELDGLSLLGSEKRNALYLEYESDFKKNLPNWTSIITSTSQYIEYTSRTGERIYKEYYDLVEDPSQMENLFASSDPADAPPKRMWRQLRQMIERGGSCRGDTCHLRRLPWLNPESGAFSRPAGPGLVSH